MILNAKKLIVVFLLSSFMLADNYTQPTNEQWEQILNEVAQIIWQQAMDAKEAVNQSINNNLREEYIDNLSSSAPRVDFITHADISDSLSALGVEADVYVSTDNQQTWINNSNVYQLGTPGYETTWEAITNTNGSDDIYWYLSGFVNSAALGLDFGNIVISESPYNSNNIWPPSDNLYALLATDPTDETSSDYDIANVRGTYSDNKLYTSLGLEGGCCNEGSFFGPWNLYVVAIVNPDAANPVAYSLGYGNGGFGQLYPALYKVDGDLTTGEVGGFEALTTDMQYSTAGNNFQASIDMNYLINDPDWGTWPNSVNGVVLVGSTVSAGLSGISISTEILDTSDPGILVMTTQYQNGNIAPTLNEPTFDSETGILSVYYKDTEGNLAVEKLVELDGETYEMIPESRNYNAFDSDTGEALSGAKFMLDISEISNSGLANFSFSDGGASASLSFEFEGGSSGCATLLGDANGDGSVDVLDVVLTVNIILCADCPDNYNVCSDLNDDAQINVLDVVSIVNTILAP